MQRPDVVRIATRKSPLALAQTRWVAARLREGTPGLTVEEVHVVTEGDRVLDKPLAKVGGKGLFVSEVEAALADGRADLAVHSMKDVPEALLPGMAIACVPPREDPRDGLVTRDGTGLMDLSAGARIGTSSLRRAIQLRRQRNDVAFTVLRGNVGTRLSRVGEGAIAAAVLALAGMKRLGLDALGVSLALEPLESRITKPETDPHPLTVTPLSVEISIPAVGQGALAIECRDDDARIRGLLAPLEHLETRIAIEAERAFLQTLHGSCSTPLAAHARFEAGMFRMDAMVGSLDGDTVLVAGTAETMSPREGAEGQARVIGRQLAERLLAEGAAQIIDEARAAADPYVYLYSR
jgi:hydroxymethylbilane synthase